MLGRELGQCWYLNMFVLSCVTVEIQMTGTYFTDLIPSLRLLRADAHVSIFRILKYPLQNNIQRLMPWPGTVGNHLSDAHALSIISPRAPSILTDAPRNVVCRMMGYLLRLLWLASGIKITPHAIRTPARVKFDLTPSNGASCLNSFLRMLRFPSSLLSSTMSEEKAHSPSLKDEKEKRNSSSSDLSVDFGGESSLPPPPTLTPEQERKLWRKVDLRLMPILSLMYLLSFLDRGSIFFLTTTQNLTPLYRKHWYILCLDSNLPRFTLALGNARLQGLQTQLHLTGNRYNIALVSHHFDNR